MRRLIAGFAARVDGYIEAPDRSYDWIIIDKSIDFAAYAKQFDTYFYGRKSYEAVMAMGNNPAHGSKHYFFSNTLSIVISFISVLLGTGKPMVDVLSEKVWLHFLQSKTYANGTLQVSYRVKCQKG